MNPFKNSKLVVSEHLGTAMLHAYAAGCEIYNRKRKNHNEIRELGLTAHKALENCRDSMCKELTNTLLLSIGTKRAFQRNKLPKQFDSAKVQKAAYALNNHCAKVLGVKLSEQMFNIKHWKKS